MTPNEADVAVFVEEVSDAKSILLLGNTRALFPLCTAAMDIDPFIDDPRVIRQDWRTNTFHYEAMIGDGLLNFDQALTREVLEMAQKYCDTLVVRTFTRLLPPMRVATFFPQIKRLWGLLRFLTSHNSLAILASPCFLLKEMVSSSI